MQPVALKPVQNCFITLEKKDSPPFILLVLVLKSLHNKINLNKKYNILL